MEQREKMTVVVHVREKYDRYIGRPRKGQGLWEFGNPFKVSDTLTVEQAVIMFAIWLETGETFGEPAATPARRRWILKHEHELRGKRIACYCKDRQHPTICHGDVYVNRLHYRVK